MTLSITRIAGIPVAALTRTEWAMLMTQDCSAANRPARPRVLSSLNGSVVSLYHRDAHFRELMDKVDAIDADGMPLVIASRIFSRRPLPERVATTDFFHDAARAAEAHGFRFYMLGGTRDEIARATARVRRLYPTLALKSHHGYFDDEEEATIIDDVRSHRTDVLWVGLGVPKEQSFAIRNADALTGVAWIKTCGGLFNFLSGKSRRAPAWLQAVGLEWAFRMMQEPRRLMRRYFTTTPHAIFLFFRHLKTPD